MVVNTIYDIAQGFLLQRLFTRGWQGMKPNPRTLDSPRYPLVWHCVHSGEQPAMYEIIISLSMMTFHLPWVLSYPLITSL